MRNVWKMEEEEGLGGDTPDGNDCNGVETLVAVEIEKLSLL